MPDKSQHEYLSEEMRSQIQQISADFTEAWLGYGSGEVVLESFLPASDDPLRRPVLHELIPIDLEQRRKRGEDVLLENYLADFPELGPVSKLSVALIAAEYRIRSLQGDPLRIDSYRQRFPKQFDDVMALLTGSQGNSNSFSSRSSIPRASDRPTPTPHSAGTLQPPPGSISAKGTVSNATPTTESTAPRKVMPVGEGYQLLECIGRGMFGEVWRAEAPGGVEVAIKMIHRTAGDQLTQMELRALELMKRLRHPFLLQVQAYWLVGDQLHIVMDLAEKTLLQRLEECRRKGQTGIPAAELLTYMHESAEALDFLHSNQVLHRDIKPANILLSKGHARLADFGLARLFMKEGTDLRATLTGTPVYMGPEVWQQKVGPESDQYSLAATYVELRIGRTLFEADSQDEVKQSHLNAVPDLKQLPAAERKVLQKALAKKLEERFKSCKKFIEALDSAILGPSKKQKPLLTRRQAVVVLGLGALSTAGLVEFSRRNDWFRSAFGMDVTAPADLSIRAGETQPYEFHVVGARGDDVKAEFTGVPDGVAFDLVESKKANKAQILRFRVSADLNMPNAAEGVQSEVTLRVEDGTRSTERKIQLTVSPPTMTLPTNFQPAPGAKRMRVAEEEANYWDRILRPLPGNASLTSEQTCEFVLIPYNNELKLPSFYILSNKVWNELFTVFDKQYVSAHPQPVDWPIDWLQRGAAKGAGDMPAAEYPLHPVMNVNYKQAGEFAKWLEGRLPTCNQWDTAAGAYLPNNDPRRAGFPLGPFKMSTDPAIAIAINGEGTLPINEADDDISPFRCRHMAGNGEEWTRDVTEGALPLVHLRGRQYLQEDPLFYSDLLDKDKQINLGAENPNLTSSGIGFRVVIEFVRPQSQK